MLVLKTECADLVTSVTCLMISRLLFRLNFIHRARPFNEVAIVCLSNAKIFEKLYLAYDSYRKPEHRFISQIPKRNGDIRITETIVAKFLLSTTMGYIMNLCLVSYICLHTIFNWMQIPQKDALVLYLSHRCPIDYRNIEIHISKF